MVRVMPNNGCVSKTLACRNTCCWSKASCIGMPRCKKPTASFWKSVTRLSGRRACTWDFKRFGPRIRQTRCSCCDDCIDAYCNEPFQWHFTKKPCQPLLNHRRKESIGEVWELPPPQPLRHKSSVPMNCESDVDAATHRCTN